MIKSTLFDLNPVEVNFYPFIVSIDKCSRSCNFVDDLPTKTCVPIKTKGINVKVFNMAAKINEAKENVKLVACAFKYKIKSKIE